MCKAPKAPKEKEPDKPEFLRNRYLDAAIGQSGIISAIRAGRSSLRIRPGVDTGSRQPGEALDQPTSVASVGSRISRPDPIGPRPIRGRNVAETIRNAVNASR